MKSTQRASRNRMLYTERRLPLNTIVLPPLEDEDIDIIQKVLVNKPKSSGLNGDVVVAGRSDVVTRPLDSSRGNDAARVSQLEQNIRFLQEQHTQMLAGLHKEVDGLRHKNRELQFQLVFTKGGIPSSPSSPEDDSKPKSKVIRINVKIVEFDTAVPDATENMETLLECLKDHNVYPSPKQVNVTPLQVEILEKELGELKIQLQDIDSRNAYLSAIVEEQKKKLERYERDREREIERATQPDPELLRKLEDAESLIRRLRRENSDLRQENNSSSASSSYQNQRGPNNRTRNRGNSAGHYRGNWFPPLHAQTYWHGGRGVERNGGNAGDSTALPSLMPGGSGNNGQYQGRRGSNNNHYHNGEGRKYKNGQNRGGKP